MERRTALLVLGTSALAAAVVVCGAFVLVRSRAPAVPADRAQERPREPALADLPPARAWELHSARKALLDATEATETTEATEATEATDGTDETDAADGAEVSRRTGEDPAEREERRVRWSGELREALARWKPTTPADRLALARFLVEDGRDTRALAEAESLSSGTGEVAREAARLSLLLRIRSHDPEGARLALERLRARAPGEDLAAAEGALVEEGVASARRRVEGPTPDVEAAKRALAAVVDLVREPEDAAADEAARAYVTLSSSPTSWRTALPGLAFPEGRAHAIVLADDFELGEPVLPSVMKRWANRLPVTLVGRETGEVREGHRREKAGTIGEHRRFAKRAGDLDVPLAGIVTAGGAEERALGLRGPGAWVFLVDSGGALVARASGPSLDPRPLDEVVRRLAP